MPANLVFRRKIRGARDNGIPPRSTPDDSLSNSAATGSLWLNMSVVSCVVA